MTGSTQVWWFAARSGGIVAWVLAVAAVLYGLFMSAPVAHLSGRPKWMLDLHRFLGGLAVIFTGVHVASLVADTWVSFGWLEVLVPFTSSWKPGAVAWGVVTMYLLLAVELTSLARRYLPRKLWRRTHGLSFVLYGTATIHLLTAGTDATNPLLLAAAWMSVVAVAGLSARRAYQMLTLGGRRVLPQQGGLQ